MDKRIEELLKMAVANKASDIHLLAGATPKLRVNGEMIEIANFSAGNETEMAQIILSLAPKVLVDEFESKKELDFSVKIDEARFRANVFLVQGRVAAALRVVASVVPPLSELNMPDILLNIIDRKQGFILVTGPTGHGKSTTVASLLDSINHNKNVHIVTIEDPIEYQLKPVKALISQREVGFDTNGFGPALRSVLRQDPNVVFVGEMRDLETIGSALTIAETGHLVFSTLHTNSASQTIDRIVDVFPEGSQDQIRVQLAETLTAVISQRLVPAVDGGRIPALELMVVTPAIKNIIREGKTFMIDNVISTSADAGMISLEAYLAMLVKKGKITQEVAESYCLRPTELQNRLIGKVTKDDKVFI
ncbi:MAG: PilT/PilU family type 4a pilus ATPase [Candidatus Shapirobacteria bacterium]|jgi:twitching motility protein PilT